jgi:hypothetical protein
MALLGLVFFVGIIAIAVFMERLDRSERKRKEDDFFAPIKDIRDEAFPTTNDVADATPCAPKRIETLELPPSGEVALGNGTTFVYHDLIGADIASYEPHVGYTYCVYMSLPDSKVNRILMNKEEYSELVALLKRLPVEQNCIMSHGPSFDELPRVLNMTRFCYSVRSSRNEFAWKLCFKGVSEGSWHLLEIANPEHDDLWMKCAMWRNGEIFAALPGETWPYRRGKIIGINFYTGKDREYKHVLRFASSRYKEIACCGLTPEELTAFNNSVAMKLREGKPAHFAETIVMNAVQRTIGDRH